MTKNFLIASGTKFFVPDVSETDTKEVTIVKIGLIDVDSHNYPNIPLMKISGYFKSQGCDVEFAKQSVKYDRIYVAKVFTESVEPDYSLYQTDDWCKGGSGFDLENKLPAEFEHTFPDYSLYPNLTKDTAFGMLTRGCPCVKHKFCITPKKDGCVSRKVFDLSEFWNGQKNIVLLDQNLLACKDRIELLQQLKDSKASVLFDGGSDVRFLNEEILNILRHIKVKDYHFAWDDPREDLIDNFKLFQKANIKNAKRVGVYCLTNYWSTIEEDLFRIYKLRELGFVPYVMIYDKQKFVDKNGRWIRGVEKIYSREQLIHFKTCQHMQRWANNRKIINATPNFDDYEWYRRWIQSGKPVPTE